MRLPFTMDEFFGVFARYNLALGPAFIVAYLGGAMGVVAASRGGRRNSQVVAGLLGAYWILMGGLYHLVFFTAINPAARLFGVLFLLQGGLFWWGGWRGWLVWEGVQATSARWLPWSLVLYAMVLYPLLGLALGHRYPAMPIFGTAPCPTVIYTFGLLLLASRPPRWIAVIPLLWSAIGGSAAVLLDVPQDYGLIASGLLFLGLMGLRREGEPRRRVHASEPPDSGRQAR